MKKNIYHLTKVTSYECIEAHCDGELFTHKGQKFSIEIRKGALEMIAGKLQSGGK